MGEDAVTETITSVNKDKLVPTATFPNYLAIARPSHWIKNVFMLPGTAAALAIMRPKLLSVPIPLFAGLVSLCLAASANYTLNEFLDAASDRFHPTKQNRPGAQGLLRLRFVLLQYVTLTVMAAATAFCIALSFFDALVLLLTMGILYNVPPIRLKDRAYIDTLSESLNNPIRLMMGWFVVSPSTLPPASALLAYWMGGAFLMGVKRFAEYRSIGDSRRAILYRRSFSGYNEQSLLLASFFFALCAAFFIAIFLIKYRIELLVTAPLFASLFTWYLAIGLRRNSAAQAPEALYKEYGLMCLAALTFIVVGVLFVINIPLLHNLMDPVVLTFPGYLH